jgi:hypothetical protein
MDAKILKDESKVEGKNFSWATSVKREQIQFRNPARAASGCSSDCGCACAVMPSKRAISQKRGE